MERYEGYLYVDWEEGDKFLQLMTEPDIELWWRDYGKQVAELVSVLEGYKEKKIRVTIEEVK